MSKPEQLGDWKRL